MKQVRKMALGTLLSRLFLFFGLFATQFSLSQPIFNITTNDTSLNISPSGTLGITYTVQNNSGVNLTNVSLKPPAGAFLSPATTCGTTLPNNTSCSAVINVTAPLATGAWLLNPLVACAFGGAVCSANPAAAQIQLHAQRATLYTGDNNNIIAINTTSNIIIATIDIGATATGFAMTPDGTKLYVAAGPTDNVSVIDTESNQLIATIAVGTAPSNPNPWGIVASPDNSKIYVANYGSDNVSVINTALNTVLATISVGVNPAALAISSDGSKLYVANEGSNDVSIIDTVTNSVINTVAGISNPVYIVISPIGNKIYVVATGGNDVAVIDATSETVISTFNVGGSPLYISLLPQQNRGYVINQADDTVSVFNMTTDTSQLTLLVGSGNNTLSSAITPNGLKLYVNAGSNGIAVVDTTSNMLLATVPSSESGANLVFNSTGSQLYVSSGSVVQTINTATDEVVVALAKTGANIVAITP